MTIFLLRMTTLKRKNLAQIMYMYVSVFDTLITRVAAITLFSFRKGAKGYTQRIYLQKFSNITLQTPWMTRASKAAQFF